MTFCIAVFRSKTDVFAFMSQLKLRGVYSQTVGTPKEARVGCGLSVKFSYSNLSVATQILNGANLSSFYALYQVKNISGRAIMSKIY